MSMKTIIENLNQQILNGLEFTTPGETELARREPFYCSQMYVRRCEDCSLVNYGRDCHNNKIETGILGPTGKVRPSLTPVSIDDEE